MSFFTISIETESPWLIRPLVAFKLSGRTVPTPKIAPREPINWPKHLELETIFGGKTTNHSFFFSIFVSPVPMLESGPNELFQVVDNNMLGAQLLATISPTAISNNVLKRPLFG